MRKLKLLAIFMITLIVTLPIYTASVFGNLNIDSISGSRNIQSAPDTNGKVKAYRDRDDTTTIKISADKDNVKYLKTGNAVSCTGINKTYVCEYKDSSTITSESKPYKTYTFYQSINGNPAGDSKTATIYVDSAAPTITINYTGYPRKEGKNYSLKFLATDYGNGLNKNGCSGIKEINFLLDGEIVGSYNFTPDVGNCEVSGNYTYQRLGNDGVKTFSAKAIDFFDHFGESEEKEMYVDTTSPTFDAHLEKYGKKIEYSSSKLTDGVTVILETTDSLDMTSVHGDLSALAGVNRANIETYKNIGFTCSKTTSQITRCISSRPISMLLTENAMPTIKITSSDTYGNTEERAIQLSLKIDDSPPGAADFFTTNCKNDGQTQTCFINPTSNILKILIQDSGAGLSNGIVAYNIPMLGIDSPTRFSSCTQSSNAWECIANLSFSTHPSNGAEVEVNIVTPSQDDAGNPIDAKTTKLIYDGAMPKIIKGPEFMQKDGPKYLSSSDIVEAKIWVYENDSGINNDKSTADFSNIVTGAKSVPAECEFDPSKPDGYYICTWHPGQAKDLVTLASGKVEFKITDYAGNVNPVNSATSVLKRSNLATDFWRVKQVRVEPGTIDRLSSQYIPGKLSVYTAVTLTSSKSLKQIYTSLNGANCQGINGSEDYYKDARIYPLPPEETPDMAGSAIISIGINKENPLPDTLTELKFRCVLLVTAAEGNVVYAPEKVPVDITVKVDSIGFNLPQDYSSRIQTFKKELKDGQLIDTLNSIMQTGQKICTTVKTIYIVIMGVAEVLDAIAPGLLSNYITWGSGKATEVISSGVSKVSSEGLMKYASWICGFFDCTLMDKLANDKGWFKAYTQAINAYVVTLNANMITQVDIKTTNDQTGETKTTSQSLFTKAISTPGGISAEEAGVPEMAKKSIFVSVLTLCIPGFLYNIEKARQIDCAYVVCAEKMISGGLNPYVCEAIRSNAYCNFVYGQIFHLIPFSGIAEALGKMLQTFTSSPVAATGMVLGLYCGVTKFIASTPADAQQGFLCDLNDRIKSTMAWFGAVMSLGNMFSGSTEKDMCKEALSGT